MIILTTALILVSIYAIGQIALIFAEKKNAAERHAEVAAMLAERKAERIAAAAERKY